VPHRHAISQTVPTPKCSQTRLEQDAAGGGDKLEGKEEEEVEKQAALYAH